MGYTVQRAFSAAFGGLVSIVKSPVNSVIGVINGLIRGVVSGINLVLKAFNKISISIPSWVPVIGGRRLGFNFGQLNTPQIPYLAQGGFVKKNTPQLAMIGDNRHQGEVVAPEDKLRQMAIDAAKAVGSGGATREELESIINNAVLRIVAALANLGFYLDGEQMARATRVAEQVLDARFNPVIAR